ncbi:MAG: ABC transporter permease, partial [Gammaproteobacteria bacterium]
YEQHFNDRAIDGMGLYVAADRAVEDVIRDVRMRLANVEQVVVRSNKEIREGSLKVFDRTFTITGVLRLLAMLIAFVGILSALMALQLEKAREFGVLRATGSTPRQVLSMVSLQTGIIGLAAGLLAIPVGLVMSQQLVHVINRRSFGWTMQTHISPGVLIEALALAVVAALIAGLYPAWKMAHTSAAEALREE